MGIALECGTKTRLRVNAELKWRGMATDTGLSEEMNDGNRNGVEGGESPFLMKW